MKINMEHSSVELNDLPDEILMIILKKLCNVEVLYSLKGVNKRLNAVAHDSIFTNRLTLMRRVSDHCTNPLPDAILDRFCLQILPEIHHKIKWLNLESSSMERILHATNYPNLYGLGLYDIINVYDELIVPYLQRMSNLEKLTLNLATFVKNTFIDGNELNQNIVSYMPRLRIFEFYICSNHYRPKQIYLPSKEYIQHTFRDFKNDQVSSYIDYFQEKEFSLCHIYSYPYNLKYYYTITNNFPGGLFKYVQEVSLYDERSFQHEFFLRIQKSFPFIKIVSIKNSKP
ncbi:unnamed protein product [Rotaria sordida]|uniref:F-box domain-containing protein n=1 Tax=Rotaria sordida TaxID=392033 RepID=A0A815HA32_9BILA|nr:unnamed protein product [Rotaria sordida]CAF3709777.1 unnamed protein product [Rotaria sordida]